MRVSVIAFAGTAAVVQAPTISRDDVIAAIDRFQLQRGTATGSGIILSLAIFPRPGIEIQNVTGQRTSSRARWGKETKPKFTPVPGLYNRRRSSCSPTVSTTGPDPLDAAKMAAERGIRVYTVGIGTKAGETIGFEGLEHARAPGRGDAEHLGARRRARYFYAGSAEDLQRLYESLSSRMVIERKEHRGEQRQAGRPLGALLVMAAAAPSLVVVPAAWA